MSKIYISLLVFLTLFISGCTSVPTDDISVGAESDPKANFSSDKTYTWLGSATIVQDSFGKWEPLGFDADAEVKYLFDSELRGRGMSKNALSPDLAIAFVAGVNMDALGLNLDSEASINMLENVPQGGLLVIFVDSESGLVIWVGLATAEVQQNVDTDTAKARLDYAVTQMIKKLPK